MIPDWVQYLLGCAGGIFAAYILMVREVHNIKGQLSILINLNKLSQENYKEIHSLKLDNIRLSKDIDSAFDKLRDYSINS